MTTPSTLKAISKNNDQISRGDLFTVDPDLLLEEPGFNSRGAFCENYYERPDIAEGIESLAQAYLRGDFVPPIIVRVKNGQVYVRDGHRRRRAILRAKELGGEIKRIAVIEHRGDEAEQTLLVATTSNGEPLTLLERAVIYGRLRHWGWSNAEIAGRVSKSPEHVRQALEMLEMPLELKMMVQAGTISASLAYQVWLEHGDLATDIVKQADGTTGAGSGEGEPVARITKKRIQTGPKIPKRLAIQMHAGVLTLAESIRSSKVTSEGYILTLNAEQMAILKELEIAVSKASAPETSGAVNDGQGELPIEDDNSL